jgi:mono/diheme cytochrome c family protein
VTAIAARLAASAIAVVSATTWAATVPTAGVAPLSMIISSPELGRALFNTHCAVCHGLAAHGDGPLAPQMKKTPPDLTEFARRNGGTFPSALVRRIIDGRQAVAGHGGPDMPVWGDAFRTSQALSDASVTQRIDALVQYLETLQQKSAE